MRRIMLGAAFMLLWSGLVWAQMDTSKNRIVVSEDVNDCINKIYDNPDAMKLLMMNLMGDKATMRKIHQSFMDDPEMKQMIKSMMDEMHGGKMDNKGTNGHEGTNGNMMNNEGTNGQMMDDGMMHDSTMMKDKKMMRDSTMMHDNKMMHGDSTMHKEK